MQMTEESLKHASGGRGRYLNRSTVREDVEEDRSYNMNFSWRLENRLPEMQI